MASEQPPAPASVSQSRRLWSRIGEFVYNVLRLERAVEALKNDNSELERRVGSLQRQVDEQSGQLKVLSDFVTKALDEKVNARAEQAAIRAFERMASLSGLIPSDRDSPEE